MHQSILKNADLTRAVLDGSDCRDADFSKANLTKASFREASIEESIFTGAILGDATWSNYKRCRASSVGECQ